MVKPQYSAFDVPGTKEAGDLAIMAPIPEGERWLFSEFVLFHDGNRNEKWQDKLEADVRKLKRLQFVYDIPLLFVLSASIGDIDNDRRWKAHIEAITQMQIPTELTRTIVLQPSGMLKIAAFDLRTQA